MKTDTNIQILELIEKNGPSTPASLVRLLEISPQAVHRQLKKLCNNGLLVRIGTAPRTFYDLKKKQPENLPSRTLNQHQLDYLGQYFSQFTPDGRMLLGHEAFDSWLIKTKQSKLANSLADSYILLHEEIYASMNSDLFFDLTEKLKHTFPECYFDKVVCSDFYSLPQFGKTYLGNLVTAGKSGQDRKSIRKIADLVTENLLKMLKKEKITAIAWVPHSIARKTLFLPVFKNFLDLDLPEIKLTKIFPGGIPIAQKSLSKLEDRIQNAKETIIVEVSSRGTNSKAANNILLIDVSLGSGATINEIAKKIRGKLSPKKIVGYAIVGSYKGFDVLSVV
jgi:hypothetical protein